MIQKIFRYFKREILLWDDIELKNRNITNIKNEIKVYSDSFTMIHNQYCHYLRNGLGINKKTKETYDLKDKGGGSNSYINTRL